MAKNTDPIRLVFSQAGLDRSRYRVVVSESPEAKPSVRIHDRRLGRVLVRWDGDLASRILESGVLPRVLGDRDDCDKRVLRELTVAAAAAGMALEREQRANTDLRHRLGDLGLDIGSFHLCVARLLFDHPEHHFSREEVVCLLGLRGFCFHRQRTEDCLDDLVAWRVVQRIDVGANAMFFDINTKPHLHVYCPHRQELRDAPSSGVVRVDGARS